MERSPRPRVAAAAVFLRRLFLGWVFLYVLAVVTLGGQPIALRAYLAAAAGWAAMLLLLGRFGGGAVAPRGLRLAEIAATNIAATLVLAEALLRLWSAWSGQSFLVQEGMAAWKLAPNHNYDGLIQTNSLGYVGREVARQRCAGVPRVAVVGDSFVVGFVPQEQNFVSRLEQLNPGVEFCNFGIVGNSPREDFESLETDVWPFAPDLILLSVTVGNDITDEGPIDHPRHLDPRSQQTLVFATRLLTLAKERWRQAQGHGPEGFAARGPFHPLSREAHLEALGRHGLCVCSRGAAPALEPNWRRALGYFDRIIASCRARGTPLCVVLQPDEIQVNPELRREALAHFRLAPEDLDLEAPQRRLTAYFAERGVPCLDLLPAFADQGAANYTPRDMHYNAAGNRLAAERIHAWLSGLDAARVLKQTSPPRTNH